MILFTVSSFAQLKVSKVKENELIGEYKMMGVVYGTLEKQDDMCYLLPKTLSLNK